MESFSWLLILNEVQLAFGYDFYKAAQLLSPSKIDVDLLPLAFTQKVGINSGEYFLFLCPCSFMRPSAVYTTNCGTLVKEFEGAVDLCQSFMW